ncbi:MAG: tetratricopeptide repeat protein [Spirochaetes bacterium]|nr:tetratricopeptide repeat protein [Spirochaetota bacterium]
MARITEISDSSAPDYGEYSYGPQRPNKNRTLILSAAVVLFIALVAGGVYYMLWQKKQTLDQARLKPATDFEEASSRKMAPDQLPQDLELKKAVEMYNRGYLKPAQAEFQALVESSKPGEVKSMALVYLGIMADDEGKFNLAADFFERAIKFDDRNFYAHYNMAIALRHKGMYKEALAALERAQRLRPDLVEAQNLKGQLQYQNQDLKGAETTLKQAIETSKDPLAYYNLGMVYKKDGKFAEAKAAFLDALNTAAAGEIAYKAATQLGMLHATQGDIPNAKYYFERAVALAPANAKYHYNLALVLHQNGENERAVRELDEAIKLGSDNPQTYMYAARLYSELGKNEQAEAALRRALAEAPKDPVILGQMGDMLVAQAKWAPAIQVFRELYESTPKTQEKAQALYNLGKVYLAVRDYKNAEKALEGAYQLDMLNEDALVLLAETYVQNGQAHRAVAAYKESLRLNPDNLKVLKGQAQLYLNLGELTEAEVSLKRLADHPNRRSEDAYYAAQMLGDLYMKRKAYDTAMQYYEKAAQSTDANLRYGTLVAQSDAMLLSDRPVQTIYPLLMQAIQLRPNADDARFLMARALVREGTMASQDKAIEELRGITSDVRSVPLASKAYTLMGIIYYKQGQLNRSMDAFNRALELDPANTEAFQNRRAVSDRLENG